MARALLSGVLLVALTLAASVSSQDEVKVGIVHYGDIKGHLDSFMRDDTTAECTAAASCDGGIMQTRWHVKKAMEKLVGDTDAQWGILTGNLVSGETGWLSVPDFGNIKEQQKYGDGGWETFGRFLNNFPNYTSKTGETVHGFQPMFRSLGIKEFESGLSATTKLVDAYSQNKPIITNIACYGKHEFCYRHTQNHTTVQVPGGTGKIGIVGFVNPLANSLADATPAEFLEPATSIQKYIQGSELAAYKTVIAIGTGNFQIAQQILSASPNVKLVIYGGGTKDLTGNYPANNGNGYIATAGLVDGVARKLGSFKLVLSKDGDLIRIESGELRPLTADISQGDDDRVVADVIQKLKDSSSQGEVVAQAVVGIDGKSCWRKECNLGNFVTDAMVHCAHNHEKVMHHHMISVWHGGAFFPDTVKQYGDIHVLDIHRWLPYHNQASLIQIKGSTLKKLFSVGAEGLKDKPSKDWGQFLQVSNGIEVTFKDQNLYKLRTMHYDGNGIPALQEVTEDSTYMVVVPSIMTRGKSVWDFLPSELISFENPKTGTTVKSLEFEFDDTCVINYAKALGFISTGFEERIFLEPPPSTIPSSECNKRTGLTVFLTLFISAVILGGGFAVWKFFVQPRRENGNFCC